MFRQRHQLHGRLPFLGDVFVNEKVADHVLIAFRHRVALLGDQATVAQLDFVRFGRLHAGQRLSQMGLECFEVFNLAAA